MTDNTPKARSRLIAIRYRGFMTPWFRRRPIRIGFTRLYTFGPIAIFYQPGKHEGHTR